jgi:hypothetical protein
MWQLVVWPLFTQTLVWRFLLHTNAASWAPVPIPTEIAGQRLAHEGIQ